MKTIKGKIISLIVPFTLVVCLVLGIIGAVLNYETASDVLKQNLAETAKVASNHVAAEIKAIQNVAIETGSVARIANPDTPVEQKKEIIDQRAKAHDFERGNILGLDGVSIFDGNNYSERDYFKAAISGKNFISEPTISKITGKLSFLIASPIWENGLPNTKIVGVVYFAPNPTFLNDIVSKINVGESGHAFLLNKEGTTIADVDASLVTVDNHIKESQTDKSLTDLAEAHKKMIALESGSAKYKHEGGTWIQGYAPIENTDGWSIGVMAKESDFLGNFYLSVGITIGTVIVFLIIGIVVATIFGNKVGNPINLCTKRIEQLSVGDLSSAVPVVNSKDETGILAEKTAVVVERLQMVVSEVCGHLTNMANGNFNLEDLRSYQGDFLPMSDATNKIVASLNETLNQINISSDQVSSGSEQVSTGAQALAQGATEQASSVEELSASITDISTKVKTNATNATNANVAAKDVGAQLNVNHEQMRTMISAISEISKTSTEISKIIKTIDDIAFQTNILALNAAVEAARAGAAGKGFAVVAEEVRNLAGKSAVAAKNTTDLINSSIIAVQNGTKIADETASSLEQIVISAQNIVNIINDIAFASNEQAGAISQVTQGVEQISAVVQTNSATAEESAAASEELSGQATMLRELVSKFTLK